MNLESISYRFLVYFVSTHKFTSSLCILLLIFPSYFPPLTIAFYCSPWVFRCSFPFAHFIFTGQQASWQHVMRGECTASMSPFPHLTLWKYEASPSIALPPQYFRSIFCHLFVILSLSICPPQLIFSCLLFVPLSFCLYHLTLHTASFCPISFLKCFASSSLLSSSSPTPPSFFHLSFCPLPAPLLVSLPPPSLFPLQVMEVCFYRKWQCKELYKGYNGFLYDTAILLITFTLSHTETRTHRHTHTNIFSPWALCCILGHLIEGVRDSYSFLCCLSFTHIYTHTLSKGAYKYKSKHTKNTCICAHNLFSFPGCQIPTTVCHACLIQTVCLPENLSNLLTFCNGCSLVRFGKNIKDWVDISMFMEVMWLNSCT